MVALAMVLGMSSSNPAGCRLLERAMDRFSLGGVDDSVEGFGGLGGNREQAYVVNHDDVGSHDFADGFGDGVIRAVSVHEQAEVFEAEPGHFVAVVDGGLSECFKDTGFAGA